jgi:acyl carrier protein
MAMETEALFEKLKEIIGQEFAQGQEITLETDLLEMGLDSLDIINLLFQIEESFGVSVPEEDFEDKNLKVLGNMVDYLSSRV